MRQYVDRICKYCGKEFQAEARNIKRGGGVFCSIKCSVIHNSKNRPPAGSGKRLRAIARGIYMERNGIPSCAHCGKLPADVHHLNKDVKDNSPENLLALCRSCHTAYHNHVSPRRKKAVNE